MKVQLIQQELESAFSLESALRQRETKRDFSDIPLTLADLSMLLFAAQGRRGGGSKLLAPSAQEQYPLSTFAVANKVSELDQALYQYDNSDHSLKLIESGSYAGLLENTALGEQPWVGRAAAIVVLTANIQSMNQHFSTQPPINQRGERYSYIEVGAVAQNMQLQAAALGIAMVLVGGFDNEQVRSVVSLPSELEPAALLCFGNV